MILHNDPLFYIYFGDARDALNRELLCDINFSEDLATHESLHFVKKLMHLNSLIFLKQVHGTEGKIISSTEVSAFTSSKQEGDYLITQLEHIGLGIYTADCLPIVFYDAHTRVIAVCHAGWPASLKKIAVTVLDTMKQKFQISLDYIQVFFGPSAKVCCYEVGPEFNDYLKDCSFIDQVLLFHGGKYFFDLPLFNKLQLQEVGVKKESFHCTYNMCTICDTSFCSYRRDGSQATRQLTIASLK